MADPVVMETFSKAIMGQLTGAAVGVFAIWVVSDMQATAMNHIVARMDLLVQSFITIEREMLTAPLCRQHGDFDAFSNFDLEPPA